MKEAGSEPITINTAANVEKKADSMGEEYSHQTIKVFKCYGIWTDTEFIVSETVCDIYYISG